MKHSPNYSDGDFEVEGVVVKVLFGEPTLEDTVKALQAFSDGQDTVEHTSPKPSAEVLEAKMCEAISRCRELGLTEGEIEHSIRLNLRTYGYADETFPVAEWMGTK